MNISTIENATTQPELVHAIAEIATMMPLARAVQLYEFALFLNSRPLPAEETLAEIAVDEARWDAQFAATTDEQFAALVASVEAEIDAGDTQPMFDANGELAKLV